MKMDLAAKCLMADVSCAAARGIGGFSIPPSSPVIQRFFRPCLGLRVLRKPESAGSMVVCLSMATETFPHRPLLHTPESPPNTEGWLSTHLSFKEKKIRRGCLDHLLWQRFQVSGEMPLLSSEANVIISRGSDSREAPEHFGDVRLSQCDVWKHSKPLTGPMGVDSTETNCSMMSCLFTELIGDAEGKAGAAGWWRRGPGAPSPNDEIEKEAKLLFLPIPVPMPGWTGAGIVYHWCSWDFQDSIFFFFKHIENHSVSLIKIHPVSWDKP